MRIDELPRMKGRPAPQVWITAYDFPTARMVEAAGVDAILVGDSYGNVVLGYETTLSVTLDDMVRAAQAVARGAPNTLRIVDLPFLSYADEARALRSAERAMQEGNAHAVKLEGGEAVADTVRRLTRFGVPVVGHLGYTPQSSLLLGRRVQGRGAAAEERLVHDAEALAQAGASAIVLELVPAEAAARVTETVPVPTIGIGAGLGCDGQVLVLHDVIGLTQGAVPKLARRYADVAGAIRDAVAAYAADVRARRFPAEEHTVHAHTQATAQTRPGQAGSGAAGEEPERGANPPG